MPEPGISILLVDDHALVRRGFRRMLEDDPGLRVIGYCLPANLFYADDVIEEIIARVNNQIITRSEILHSKDELRKKALQQDPVNAENWSPNVIKTCCAT